MAANNERLKLAFRKPVSNMLMQASVFQSMATKDQAALEAVNPAITAAWLSDFLQEIDDASSLRQPWAAIAATGIITEALKALVAGARNAVQELYFYVGMAWPDSAARLAAYGRGEYVASRQSAWRMVKLMEKALAQAAEDAAGLDAVGYTAAKRAALEALMNQLQAKIVEQDAQKSAARLVTEQYHIAMNGVWARMVVLQRTSEIAFRNDYARWANYRLYEGKKTTRTKKKPIPVEDAVKGVGEMAEKVEGMEGNG